MSSFGISTTMYFIMRYVND